MENMSNKESNNICQYCHTFQFLLKVPYCNHRLCWKCFSPNFCLACDLSRNAEAESKRFDSQRLNLNQSGATAQPPVFSSVSNTSRTYSSVVQNLPAASSGSNLCSIIPNFQDLRVSEPRILASSFEGGDLNVNANHLVPYASPTDENFTQFNQTQFLTPPPTPESGRGSPGRCSISPDNYDNYFSNFIKDVKIQYCPHHSDNKYYCTQCTKVLCGGCTQYHQQQGHLCYSINGGKEWLQNAMQELEKMIETLGTGHKNRLEEIILQEQKVTNDIKSSAAEKQKLVYFRGQELLQDLKKMKGEKLDELNQKNQLIKNNDDQIQLLLSISETAPVYNQIKIQKNINTFFRDLQVSNSDDYDVFSFKSNEKDIYPLIDSFGSVRSNVSISNVLISGLATEALMLYQNTFFTITLNDHLGNKKMTGKDAVKAEVTFPNGFKKEVEIKFNGVYEGIVFAKQEGSYYFSITLRGTLVASWRVMTKRRISIRDSIRRNNKFCTLSGYPTNMNSSKKSWGLHCTTDGTILLADKEENCIKIFNHKMKLFKSFGRKGDKEGEFNKINAITVDRENRIVLVDKDNHRIQVLTMNGEFLLEFGKEGNKEGEFRYPWDVATNFRGEIAVTDSGNNRIQLFDSSGKFITMREFNKVNFPHYRHINNASSTSASPRGLCFYDDNRLFFSDFHKGFLALLIYNRWDNKLFFDVYNVDLFSTKIDYPFDHTPRPQGILITDNHILVAEGKYGRILVYRLKTLYAKYKNVKVEPLSCVIDPFKMGAASNFQPCNLAISPEGYLYALDGNTGDIYRFA